MALTAETCMMSTLLMEEVLEPRLSSYTGSLFLSYSLRDLFA